MPSRKDVPPQKESAITAPSTPAGPETRVARDHAAIARLADELLPALIARLGDSGLGEIEVREGEWKARLRKPCRAEDRRAAGRGGGLETRTAHGHPSARGATSGHAHVPGEDRERRGLEEDDIVANLPIAAVSPAVGVFHPRKDIAAGARVRAGDRIGTVDVLGVREDVVAPVDGVIGTSLVEAGEAVEYGQELIRIELPENARGLDAGGVDREAAAVLGEA